MSYMELYVDGEEKTDGIEGVFPMAVGARGGNLAQGD
jgi:hypothetical protein